MANIAHPVTPVKRQAVQWQGVQWQGSPVFMQGVQLQGVQWQGSPMRTPMQGENELSLAVRDNVTFNKEMHELFLWYARGDQKLQLDEMFGLIVFVCAKYGVDKSAYRDRNYMEKIFQKFDLDESGYIDENEAQSLIKCILYTHIHGTGQQITFQKEQVVEYNSATHRKWLECKICDIRKIGDEVQVQVDIKPGTWLSRDEQRNRLRDPRSPHAMTVTNEKLSTISPPVKVQLPGRTFGLIVWNDYDWYPLKRPHGAWGPLDTAHGGAYMKSLMEISGVHNITELYRKQSTKELLKNAIKDVGAKCGPQDTLVFYYTGHGAQVKDQNGDEDDGFDECICTVGANGSCGPDTWTTDDEFAYWLTKYVKADNLILLMDCCHSGSIADLDKFQWVGKNAISISGCADAEKAHGTGTGGVLTRAIFQTSHTGKLRIGSSVSEFYNDLLDQAEIVKQQVKSPQTITIRAAFGCHPSNVAWPLIPKIAQQRSAVPGAFQQPHIFTYSMQASKQWSASPSARLEMAGRRTDHGEVNSAPQYASSASTHNSASACRRWHECRRTCALM